MTLCLNNKTWGRGFPHVSQPKILGYFSMDGNRQQSFDSSQLQYYHPPNNTDINFNLNDGIDSVHRKDASADDEKIDNMLRWMINNKYNAIRQVPDNEKRTRSYFVCWRGLLTKIMKTPYDKKEGWIICAAKWRGTIYLCAFDTEADRHEKLNRSEKTMQFMSWGFKFEQYVVSDAPDKLPDTTKPVDEAEEFCCMFETCLTNNSILYGAEMDGILCNEVLSDPLPVEKLKFIELKTSRIVEKPQQFITLKRFKFLRWWCQSFLVGIENLICGFRDDKGIVREIKDYRVSELARMSKEFWSAAEAMNFCDAFLKHVAKTVVNDYDRTIYKFERIPFGDINVTELPPNREYSFLPDWYTQRENKKFK